MSKILLIIPHDRFRDEEYISVSEILRTSGHEVAVGSSHHTEAQGHFGLLVKPDVNIGFVEDRDYDVLVFIGGRGVEEYLDNDAVMSLIIDFHNSAKLVAALGMAVEILVYAGIISGKKVTCDNGTIPKVLDAGGYYTGRLTEVDSNILTGAGLAAREEFAKEIVLALEYENRVRGYENARTPGSRNYKR